MASEPDEPSSEPEDIPDRVKTALVLGWFLVAGIAFLVAHHEGWHDLTEGPRPLVVVLAGIPFLLICVGTAIYYESRNRASDQVVSPKSDIEQGEEEHQ